MLNSSFVDVNGIRLHVVQGGPEDGPLAILLHGFPEFWYAWNRYIEPLAAAGFRVLVPDQRGYNLSDKPKGIAPYQIDYLAQDVLALAQAYGHEKVYLAGHDWGAAVAWWFALRYPQHLHRLAILNVPHPAVMLQTLKRSLSQLHRSTYIFFFQIPVLPEAILRANDWRIAIDILLQSSLPGTFSEEDIEHYRRAWWQKDAFTSMLNWYRAAVRMQPALPENLRVQSPTLMLWGVHDSALGQEMAQPSIDLCDQGKLILFDNATHWVHHEQVTLISALLIDFFNDCSWNKKK
jgi:pimeloyl-ACP methyl ester carboxylesterase